MKPHIKYWRGVWECAGNGLHSFGDTPALAWLNWRQFCRRMRVAEDRG